MKKGGPQATFLRYSNYFYYAVLFFEELFIIFVVCYLK